MRSWLFALFCLTSVVCFAQTKTITGVVQDSLGKPIPYAVIIVQHSRVGVVADASGNFLLSIPDSLMKSSLIVSCIGYETKNIPIATLTTGVSNSILLSYKQIILAPLMVSSQRAKFCPEIRGAQKKRTHASQLMKSGGEVALFIPTTTSDSGIIKAVRYYIKNIGVPDAPFRVKLYNINPVTKAPGELLFDHDTIVHASGGNQWLEIDLTDYNIPIPGNGFFVAMQWLPDAQAYTRKLGDHEMNGNGQVIGLMKSDSMVHWLKLLTHDWVCSSTFTLDLHPMFAAVLSKECK